MQQGEAVAEVARQRSSDQIREDYRRAMEEDLGALCYALFNQISRLHVKWEQYRSLYGHSAEPVDLLNEIAPNFFRTVQDVLLDEVLLHIARLIDSPESMGQKNLTLRRLPLLIRGKKFRDEVQSSWQYNENTSFARDRRNALLARYDLELALGTSARQLEAALPSD